MHHRGCTRARAINLHFIIFFDAFTQQRRPWPPSILTARDGEREGERHGSSEGDFIDRVLYVYDVGPYPAISFLLIRPSSSRYSRTSRHRRFKRTKEIPRRFSVARVCAPFLRIQWISRFTCPSICPEFCFVRNTILTVTLLRTCAFNLLDTRKNVEARKV